MIVVRPFGGLCNRLRVIDSALTLARRRGTGVAVIWELGGDMVARFGDLCQPVPGVTLRETGRFRFVRTPWRTGAAARALVGTVNRMLRVPQAFFEADMARVWDGALDSGGAATASGDLYFFTCQSFTHWSTLDFSWVRPIAPIQERIDAIAAAFDEQTIGVHIRRTDHVIAMRESPLELFVERLDARARGGRLRCFLATDDPEAERRLVERFGRDAIVRHPKTFGRDTVAATQDAVVDLFCLAQTREILASSSSSFSQTAAVMGRRPISFVRK